MQLCLLLFACFWCLKAKPSHLALGDEDAPERVKANRGAVTCLPQPALQVKHGDAWAEEL